MFLQRSLAAALMGATTLLLLLMALPHLRKGRAKVFQEKTLPCSQYRHVTRARMCGIFD